MIASHALALVGVPINRVLKRVRQVRAQRYRLLRGFYRGMSDRDIEGSDQPRLHSVWLSAGAWGIGHRLSELQLESLGCEITAIRRRGIRAVEPAPDTLLEEGDIAVLLGGPATVTAAEERLLRGLSKDFA